MERQSSLSPIDEDDKDPRGRSEPCEDLPLVTPKVRTLSETTQRQNAENAMLRKQLLQFKEKEEQLHARVQELEELTDTLVATAGRNPPDETANTNIAFTPRAAIPSSSLGLTPRVPRPQDVAYQAALKQQQAEQTKEAANLTEELKSETGILKLFSKLAQALTDNNNVA
jgi:hypothetical protein